VATANAELLREMEQAIRAAGGRMTAQRRALLAILAETSGHFTANDVIDRACRARPDLDRSTVYRMLVTLRELGVLRQTSGAEGPQQFEVVARDHHHLVCSVCGWVAEIDDDTLDPLRRHLLKRYGFRAELEHHAIRGACAHCARAG
jgi:Fe2+ or Zn2+ uptake regulation protein